MRAADTRAAPPRKKDFAGELHTGKFKASLLKDVDLVCISPGLSLQEEVDPGRAREEHSGRRRHRTVRLGAKRGKVLAVTGTNGKSTVTALTGHLLRSAGIDCEVAGNISPPALDALLKRKNPPAAWVLELSSYQLETTWSLAPDAAAMLNLSEDHLDRYAGLAAYAEAKARIFQGDGAQVLNRCDSASMALALPGRTQVTFGLDAPEMPEDFGLADGWLVRGSERILAVADLPLAGAHNASNALAACALAHCRGRAARRARAGPAQLSRPAAPHAARRACAAASSGWTIPRAPTSAPRWPR